MALFVAENQHAEACGLPPAIEAGRCDYSSYFENEHGEQWVFVYDRTRAEGTLYGGDIGWENPSTFTDPAGTGLVLGVSERLWLAACWLACHPDRNPVPWLLGRVP